MIQDRELLGRDTEQAARIGDYPRDRMAHLYEALQGDGEFLSEAYIEGKVALQFDFRVGSNDLDGGFKHQIAVFQRIPGVDITALDWGLDISHPNDLDFERVRRALNGGEGGKDCPMFVFVGQSPERGKKISAWAVRSLVWLAEFDIGDGPWVDPLDQPIPPLAFTVAQLTRWWLIENWEGRGGGGIAAIRAHQLVDQIVQGRTEVLDEISDEKAPVNWRGVVDADMQQIARRLHIYLGDESIGLGFSLREGPDLGVERLKMKTCPLDLGHTSGQGSAYRATVGRMAHARKPKQKTSKGLEIPIPTKGDFDASMRKVAPPAGRKSPGGKGRSRSRDE